jgi:hypothetical protein
MLSEAITGQVQREFEITEKALTYPIYTADFNNEFTFPLLCLKNRKSVVSERFHYESEECRLLGYYAV